MFLLETPLPSRHLLATLTGRAYLLARFFSFFHILIKPERSGSRGFCDSNMSSVSRSMAWAAISRPSRSKSLIVFTNLASKLRVKVCPGFSERIRVSMMALYCAGPCDLAGLERYLRIRTAASFAALALDSAASTIAGKWRKSSA